MNEITLKNYIEKVYRLEAFSYQQNVLISSVQNKINQLRNWTEREKTSKSSFWGELFDDSLVFPASGVGFLIGLFIMCKNFFTGRDGGFVWIILLPLCFGGCVILIDYLKWEDRENTRNQKNEEIEKENAETKQRNQKQINILMREMNVLQREKQETARILNLYYSKNIIFPKYRNLIAISSFYEYFASGRCRTLEGHEGAYNIFENEIRQNLIIQKLDDVIAHLERIENNQYMLYSAIQESNRNTRRLSQELTKTAQSLRQIESNTAICAYNSQITAKNTEFLKWIEFMR